MNKKAWIALIVLIVIIGGIIIAGAMMRKTDGQPAVEQQVPVLTGTVSYRERIALPAGSVVEVSLQDTSRADAPSVVLGSTSIVTKGENVPIPFSIQYDGSKIDPRFSYSVAARILVDGELRWINTSNVPVLTKGNPSADVAIMVSAAGKSSTSATPAPSEKNPILGTEWTWMKTTFLDGTTTTAPAGKFVLKFNNDLTLSSTTDCNGISGKFIVDGEVLSVGPLASTLMACISPTLEGEYNKELSRTTSYVIKGNELRINLLKDTGTMIFAKHG